MQTKIIELKARLFDAQEYINDLEKKIDQFQKTLMQIVSITGAKPAEGSDVIAFEEIVDSVAALQTKAATPVSHRLPIEG